MKGNTFETIDTSLDRKYEEFPLWDTEPINVPPRSRLYALVPIGLGTPEVESLSSYITRLAYAHSFTVRRLVMREIVPAFERDSPLMQPVARRIGARINGFSLEAERWCDSLERLTSRNDLRFCTFLPWRELFDSRRLIRDDRAWCPRCFDEWRQSDQTVYEPLIWSCEAAKVCARHRIPLEARCPVCTKQLPILSSMMQAGFCSSCGGWLGKEDVFVESHETDREVLMTRALGTMLEATPVMQKPVTTECLKEAIAECLNASDMQNLQQFCREIGVTHGEVRSWMLGC